MVQLGPHNITIQTQLMLTKPRVYTVQLAAHQVHMLWLSVSRAAVGSLSTVVLAFSL